LGARLRLIEQARTTRSWPSSESLALHRNISLALA
jgi:hypothetical protein